MTPLQKQLTEAELAAEVFQAMINDRSLSPNDTAQSAFQRTLNAILQRRTKDAISHIAPDMLDEFNKVTAWHLLECPTDLAGLYGIACAFANRKPESLPQLALKFVDKEGNPS